MNAPKGIVVNSGNIDKIFRSIAKKMKRYAQPPGFFYLKDAKITRGGILDLKSYRGRGRPRKIDYLRFSDPAQSNGVLGSMHG